MDQPVVCLFVTNGDSPIHHAKMTSHKKMVVDRALVIKPMGKTFFNFKPAARHLVARYKVDSVAEVKPIEVSLVETLHRREVKVVGFYRPVNDMELNVGDSNVVKGAGA